jgi:hypothetical protein
MAAPIPTMTVTFDIPVLAELLQANRDLRTVISDLRIELSTRIQAIETHLTSQRTDHSTLTATSRDLTHNVSPIHDPRLRRDDLHVDQDLHVQSNDLPHQDVRAQQDDNTHRHDHVDQDDGSRSTSRTSSPSVDQGLTVVDYVSPAPAVGRKRKRTANSHVGKSPYIKHAGFVIRGSDTQLAQRRLEASPSRSESPFDSSDKLETLPPVRPRSRLPVSPPRPHRLQRPKDIVDQNDTEELAVTKPEETSMRYDYRLL